MRQGIAGRTSIAVALVAIAALLLAGSASADKRYRDDVFKRVKVTRDIVYGSAPVNGVPQDLKLDLYAPKGDSLKKRPLAIWVHGGGFSFGDKSSGPAPILAKEFARKGYVTASIDYRLLATGPCNGDTVAQCYGAAVEAVHDAQAAVAFLRAGAKTYGIDRKRVAMGGESAGAIMSTGVAALDGDPGDGSGPADPTKAIEAFSSISGGLPGALFIDDQSAPGILFSALDDPVVPYQWSVDTNTKLTSLGIASKLVTFQSGGHVPFDQYGDVMEKGTAKFYYSALGLKGTKGAGPVR